jgi:peptidoglycan/LPS O-acetylase OafA/YrhL
VAGPAPARAAGLDGVRALAVLAVLAFHEGLPWITGGFLGVDVFFVLSGYLITDLLVSRLSRGGAAPALGKFWLRRARRLLPALAAMLVTVTAAVAVLERGQLGALRPALLGAVTYTSNWMQALQHQSYFQIFGPPPPLQHLWSLAVEEQFYLFWPLVVALLVKAVTGRRRIAVPVAGAVGSALIMLVSYHPGGDPSRVYFGTDTHASGLMIGATLALCLPLARLTKAGGALLRRLDLLGLAGMAVLAWACWHLSGSNQLVYPTGLMLASLAAGALVLAAAAPGVVGTALSWRPLRWLGVRSYGIYLWHWPVIALTQALAVRAAASALVQIGDAALAVGIAAVSWRWLEEPILRQGLLPVVRSRWQQLRLAAAQVRSSPAAAAPLAGAAAVLAVAGTAGYGIIVTSRAGPTLQQQIAAGSKISGSTQTVRTMPVPGAAAPPPVPFHPGARAGLPAGTVVPRHSHRAGTGQMVTAVGDSVMLSAAGELQAELPGIYINAQISRQFNAGVTVVRRLRATGRLRQVVVVALGTNGTVSVGQVRELHAAVGARWLLLVNTFVPRPWERPDNAILAAAAGRYRNIKLVNWKAAIQHRTGLLWSDGVHPQPAGGTVYAMVLKTVVVAALAHHVPAAPAPVRVLHRRSA